MTVRKIWKSKKYYDVAHEGSLDIAHPGMKVLRRLAKTSKFILDLGCGEGTRLNLISGKGKVGIGVDISSTAIKRARKNYPNLKFIKGDLVKLPFEDDKFDLVYSAFVLEHLEEPEKMIKSAIKITKKNGYLVLVAPNYGAPNRASPPSEYSRVLKFLSGFVKDMTRLFNRQKKLNWRKVKPIASGERYEPDWDTTIEPYLGTLVTFLKKNKLKIDKTDSVWIRELTNAKIHQKLFRILGNLKVYPFKYWGPHLVVVAQK